MDDIRLEPDITRNYLSCRAPQTVRRYEHVYLHELNLSVKFVVLAVQYFDAPTKLRVLIDVHALRKTSIRLHKDEYCPSLISLNQQTTPSRCTCNSTVVREVKGARSLPLG